MRVIVAGIRTLADYSVVCRAVEICDFNITMVVSGREQDDKKYRAGGLRLRGVDALGERWARQNNVPFIRYSPNWDRYGKRAGPKRNREMAVFADALLAIWDGRSRGTKDMIDVMFELEKPIFVYSIQSRKVGDSSGSKNQGND